MITFPCAKINLGLNIVSKRKDGYHNLEKCSNGAKRLSFLLRLFVTPIPLAASVSAAASLFSSHAIYHPFVWFMVSSSVNPSVSVPSTVVAAGGSLP